jgi:hypothetical protein
MRASIRIVVSAFIVSMFAFPGAGVATAETEAKTAQGEGYISGGVALDERDALGKRRSDFSLWVATAAKKTGSYLSDVQIKISDAAGKTVLDTRLDGPWLLVDLKPGRYTVEAGFGKQTQRKSTNIGKGGHREMLFYFDLEVQTLPKGANG